VEGIQDKKIPLHFLQESLPGIPVLFAEIPNGIKTTASSKELVLLIQSCDATSHTNVYCRLPARHGVSDHATSLIGFARDRTYMVIYGNCKQMDAGFVMHGRFSVVNKFEKRRLVNWNWLRELGCCQHITTGGLTGTALEAKPIIIRYKNTAAVKIPCKTFTKKRDISQVTYPIQNNLMHFN
jgi:hypothetical protein